MKDSKTSRERIANLRKLAQNPIAWSCTKQHAHVTRSCAYTFAQPSWGDMNFLIGELDRKTALLLAEEIYDN